MGAFIYLHAKFINSVFLMASCFSFWGIFPARVVAQTVDKVKKDLALLVEVGDEVCVDDVVYAVNKQGEKVASLRVSSIKNKRAVAHILSGDVSPGSGIIIPSYREKELRKKFQRRLIAEMDEDFFDSILRKEGLIKRVNAIGIMAGYGVDSLKFSAWNDDGSYKESASFSGNSSKFKAMYDYQWTSFVKTRILAGYDSFNGSYSPKNTSINQDKSSKSKIAVESFALDGMLLWNFYRLKPMNLWLGGGGSLHYDFSFFSNVASLQAISLISTTLLLGAGADIKISPSNYIPVAILYNIFNAGTGLAQNSMVFMVGWAFSY